MKDKLILFEDYFCVAILFRRRQKLLVSLLFIEFDLCLRFDLNLLFGNSFCSFVFCLQYTVIALFVLVNLIVSFYFIISLTVSLLI